MIKPLKIKNSPRNCKAISGTESRKSYGFLGARFNNKQSLIFNLQSLMNSKSSMSKGFTLIEVMIVVAILAVMSSTLFSLFQGSLFSQKRGTSKALVYSEARAALDMMSKEIEKAMVDERIGAKCLGEDGGNVDIPDTFLFIAPLNPGKKKDIVNDIYQGELCEVGYWVKNTPDVKNTLMRHYTSGSTDFDLTTGLSGSDQLIGNVSDLQFLYFDGQQWTTDGWWDDGDSNPIAVLPRAIKITLVMQYEMEKDEIRHDTFITIVNIPGSGQ